MSVQKIKKDEIPDTVLHNVVNPGSQRHYKDNSASKIRRKTYKDHESGNVQQQTVWRNNQTTEHGEPEYTINPVPHHVKGRNDMNITVQYQEYTWPAKRRNLRNSFQCILFTGTEKGRGKVLDTNSLDFAERIRADLQSSAHATSACFSPTAFQMDMNTSQKPSTSTQMLIKTLISSFAARPKGCCM